MPKSPQAKSATTPPNPFKPFGDDVRFVCLGDTQPELAPNLADLCLKHGADVSKATKLPFPNGSVALMATKRGELPNHLYIGEAAYAVFMAWIDGGLL